MPGKSTVTANTGLSLTTRKEGKVFDGRSESQSFEVSLRFFLSLGWLV